MTTRALQKAGIAILGIIVVGSLVVHFTARNKGLLELTVPVAGVNVYVDNRRTTTSTTDDELLKLHLSVGSHDILAYKEGYLPWEKELPVVIGETTAARVFLVSASPIPTDKAPGSTEYTAANNLFTTALPTTIMSPSGNVTITRTEKTITAHWNGDGQIPSFFCSDEACDTSQVVFNSVDLPVTSFGFFKDREDVIIFSRGNGVYAIEIDRRGTQNFFPIYTGVHPRVATKDGILYVKDADKIFAFSL